MFKISSLFTLTPTSEGVRSSSPTKGEGDSRLFTSLSYINYTQKQVEIFLPVFCVPNTQIGDGIRERDDNQEDHKQKNIPCLFLQFRAFRLYHNCLSRIKYGTGSELVYCHSELVSGSPST